MQNYRILLPIPFNSNMFVYKESVSRHLTKLVEYRLMLNTSYCSLEYISDVDQYLQKLHFRLEYLIQSLDTLENECFPFGVYPTV